eukprot:CAMPEP_0169106218 /NCGR_PEP_ID=MMETSP1015-20121227/24219_1 /TAXON_ID=342587 /ORGANISM="Karlodinium micrum, Strain CCMP2283" /LENGTH=126 /DNA_ID=CAMNT_0009167643 /DNA_START=46 /DNA_END=426 /DNA_ORIENTATION=-
MRLIVLACFAYSGVARNTPYDGSFHLGGHDIEQPKEDKLTQLLLALGSVTSSPSTNRLHAPSAHSMRSTARMEEAAGEDSNTDFWSAPGDEEEEGEEVSLLPYLGYSLFLLFLLPLFTTIFGFDSD